MADQTPPVVDEPRGSLFSNLVAIVGLIILIVVVIWGLIHLVGLSQGWFSSLFGGSSSKISINAPAQVTSGEPFTVSWKFSPKEKGNYAFVYQCKSGLEMKTAAATIPCGNAFTIGTGTSLTLTPMLSGAASTTVPISIAFLPSATSSKLVQGSASIIVRSAAVAQGSTSPSPTPPPMPAPSPTPTPSAKPPEATKPASTTPAKPSGRPADLAVRILAIGVIDPNTGYFVNRAPMYPGEIAAAQFDISNVGGTTSGTYYFSANLPTLSGYVYNSPAQPALAPGDHVLNTLRWSESSSVGTFTVAVSGDRDESNNYASVTIGNGYYTPQPYYYPQY